MPLEDSVPDTPYDVLDEEVPETQYEAMEEEVEEEVRRSQIQENIRCIFGDDLEDEDRVEADDDNGGENHGEDDGDRAEADDDNGENHSEDDGDRAEADDNNGENQFEEDGDRAEPDDDNGENQFEEALNQESNEEYDGEHGATLGYPLRALMEFSSLDELYNAYKEHSRLRGFNLVKRTRRPFSGTLACDRSRRTGANKTTKRVGCRARLNYKINPNGSCIIKSIYHKHVHELNPTYSALMPGHRQLGVHLRRQLVANDIAGIRPCKNIRLLEVQAGGPENVGCTPKDCRNFIDQQRRLRLGEGDAQAVQNMFAMLQLKDPSFFYLFDTDSDGRLQHVLWIHPRCRMAYQEFHDVVSFDTTYLVNKYHMPFASVVGVNHHGHSILLGCALLSNEEADTFKWFFSNWITAMGGVYPNAIITDQCESIKKAIRAVMPSTIHRYCIWHILQKLPKKLGGKVANYNKCSRQLTGIVYDSLDINTFESKWDAFLEEYRLRNNAWLDALYKERHNWVPVYLHHTFWAGMISTQRSESMHSYFDEYIHSSSTLKQFMEHYDMALSSKTRKELKVDHDSKYKKIQLKTIYHWERQFQEAYTNDMFRRVQEQIDRKQYCHVVGHIDVDLNIPGSIQQFKVLERCLLNDYFHKEYTYTVEWRPNGSYIKCNCKNLEFKGILCSHIMEVLSQQNIRTVHERYLLDRWKKTINRPHSKIFFAGNYPHMTDEYKKYQEVEKCFQQCVDYAIQDVEKLSSLKEVLTAIKHNWEQGNVPSSTPGGSNNNVQPSTQRRSNNSTPERPNNTVPSNGNRPPILDPNVVARKGRPKEKRHRSLAETAFRAQGSSTRPPTPKAPRAPNRGTSGNGSTGARVRGGSTVAGLDFHTLELFDETDLSSMF